ncbi:MAG: DUF922 domain-containing protein [Cyclobacteriaceae bacterium]|nr:DUF922 domain-containing protein [Cyclobacteriaceae bacterium]
MKYLLSFLLFGLSYITLSQVNGDFNVICWHLSEGLANSDFVGKPDSNFVTSSGNKASAVSSLYLNIYSNHKERFVVEVCFDRLKSWMKEDSHLLLQHEQIHFNIYELHARNLRKSLDSLGYISSHKYYLVDILVNNTYNKIDDMNTKYDRETWHGIIKSQQLRWNNEVLKGLIKLESYQIKSNMCTCTSGEE